LREHHFSTQSFPSDLLGDRHAIRKLKDMHISVVPRQFGSDYPYRFYKVPLITEQKNSYRSRQICFRLFMPNLQSSPVAEQKNMAVARCPFLNVYHR
jgi:hypothetical protein